MQITVRINGTLAQKIGLPRLAITLSEPATIQDLLNHLQEKYPQATAEISAAIAVNNGTHQSPQDTLENGQTVALLMPIAGG